MNDIVEEAVKEIDINKEYSDEELKVIISKAYSTQIRKYNQEFLNKAEKFKSDIVSLPAMLKYVMK